MNNFDNGRHLGESQRQPGMRYPGPGGQPNGPSSPQDGYGRPVQQLRPPPNGNYGSPGYGPQYFGPRRPNPVQPMPNQAGPRQMPYRGPPQGPPRGIPHGPPQPNQFGPQRSQRPLPGLTFTNLQGQPATGADGELDQHTGQLAIRTKQSTQGDAAPPSSNGPNGAPGLTQQPSPLYVAPIRADPHSQSKQAPPPLSQNHSSESQQPPVGLMSQWPLGQSQSSSASTSIPSPSEKLDEDSHCRSHGSYASSAAVPEAWNRELVPAPAKPETAPQNKSPEWLSTTHGKSSATQSPKNETNNPTSVSHPGSSPEPHSNSQPDSAEDVIIQQPVVSKSVDTRASVSSLSDLILRATKLATFIDKNQRPVSKMAPLAEFNNVGEKNIEAHGKISQDRQSSDFSDMLAAFPPVNQQYNPPNPPRASWFQRMSGHFRPDLPLPSNASEDLPPPKKGRRCCGMPVWAFIILIALLLCAVAAAIIIPLELFVLKGFGNNKPPASTEGKGDCRDSLVCKNGGMSVLSQGTCACICIGGFTGAHCDETVSVGCATTNLVGQDGSVVVGNVTVGLAIPRLVADANANFSIALSGTSILAKFSNTNLSCIAQNSLVTFNGQSGRSENKDKAGASKATKLRDLSFSGTHSHSMRHNRRANVAHKYEPGFISERDIPAKYQRLVARATSTSPQPTITASPFNATERVLDFARVAVLFILQEQDLDAATKAQSTLESLFQKATNAQSKHGTLVSDKEVQNVTVGGQNTVDLVKLSVHLG